jgi:thioredoxin reductase
VTVTDSAGKTRTEPADAVFAAGDVRHGSTKRVAGAVGDGAMAAALVFTRLADLGLTV